jgi:hypothetical protein
MPRDVGAVQFARRWGGAGTGRASRSTVVVVLRAPFDTSRFLRHRRAPPAASQRRRAARHRRSWWLVVAFSVEARLNYGNRPERHRLAEQRRMKIRSSWNARRGTASPLRTPEPARGGDVTTVAVRTTTPSYREANDAAREIK